MSNNAYTPVQPAREEIDALTGTTLLIFGTNWCGHCQASQPFIDQAADAHPDVKSLQVEDGSGRALGRSFHVKLWPTVIALKDGREVARVVRPLSVAALEQVLAAA